MTRDEPSLRTLVDWFVEAIECVDRQHPREPGKQFRPGFGPLSESFGLKLLVDYLRTSQPTVFQSAGPRRYEGTRQECDLVIPGTWAIEFKLVRPFGDNGKEGEHWSENAIHPYAGNVSAVGDCFKLLKGGFTERPAIIVYGFEHANPKRALEPAIRAFEVIADQVCGIRLSPRIQRRTKQLVHPVHEVAMIYSWEVLRTPGSHGA